jgi:16S rRNA (cytosine1402-N4)-methyltransferase
MEHYPVLFEETLEGLNIRPSGIYLDGTFGRGGHARGILARLGEDGRLYGLDRDPQAAEHARGIDDPRFHFVASPFSAVAEVATELDVAGRVDGLLLDLGVSSPQLDQAERGFSFMKEGPLDMRMDTRCGMTAAEWLNQARAEDIARVLKEYGEERFAKRIARAIVEQRDSQPLATTADLAQLIEKASPSRERQKHPATRSFQAIRIHINDELGELRRALEASLGLLAPHGRLVVISFHSLEDRIVKRFMRDQAQGDPIPKGVPITGGPRNARLRIVVRKASASKRELGENPRSRSAVLRVAEGLA